MRQFGLAAVAAASTVLMLAAPQEAWAQKSKGRTSSEVEAGVTRANVGRTIGINQFIQFSEEVLNQMLTSPGFQSLLASGERPRIVVGDTVNNSHNDDIRSADITNHLRDVLVESQLVRLYEAGNTDVDLILSSQLTSSVVTADNRSREYSYQFTVKLTRPDGEFLGSWSANKVFVK